jgi:hypothetical protein
MIWCLFFLAIALVLTGAAVVVEKRKGFWMASLWWAFAFFAWMWMGYLYGAEILSMVLSNS